MGLDFSICAKIEYTDIKNNPSSFELEVCYWRKDYGIRDKLIDKYIKEDAEGDVIVPFDMMDIPEIMKDIEEYALDVDNIDSIFDKRHESCSCFDQLASLQSLKFLCDDVFCNEELDEDYYDLDISTDEIKKITNIELYFVNSY
mgnify:CR=1 FL=1